MFELVDFLDASKITFLVFSVTIWEITTARRPLGKFPLAKVPDTKDCHPTSNGLNWCSGVFVSRLLITSWTSNSPATLSVWCVYIGSLSRFLARYTSTQRRIENIHCLDCT